MGKGVTGIFNSDETYLLGSADFTGEKANLAKQRALVIAHTFNSKMNPGKELDLEY